jgi:hypothetical protein
MTNEERVLANNLKIQKCLILSKDIIKPSGTLSIDENKIYDVTPFASVDVNVPSGGGGSTVPVYDGWVVIE